MKHLKISSAFLMLALLASCGGGNKQEDNSESISMKPETTTVSGDMGECFKVVDKEYKVVDDGWSKLITIELERTDFPLPFDLTSDLKIENYGVSMSTPFIQVGFGIEFLDEDGTVLDKVSANGAGLSGSYSPDEAVELVKLKPGEKGTIRFVVQSAAENATKFKISSSYTENGGYSSSSSSSDGEELAFSDVDDNDNSSVSRSSSSSKNWDALLDSYEQYVNKYISFAKKAAKGDMSAMAEYPSLMEKAQEYGDQLKNAHGDMTTAQWARYMKITQKMANAAQDL